MNTKYDRIIRDAVALHLPETFDWRLYKALLWQESRFIPTARSPVGAMGIAQIMPMTWAQWGRGGNPDNPHNSINTGARYLGWLYDQWSWPRPELDRHLLAMASYNAGLGNILKAQKLSGNESTYAPIIKELPNITGNNSKETIDYSEKILGFYIEEVLYGS